MKKKVIIIVFAILLAVGITGTFWGTSIAEAASNLWDSCPRGEVNDPYPGDCRLYVDTNGDHICDRSQSQPVSSVTTTASGSGITLTPSITTTAASDIGSIVSNSGETASDIGLTGTTEAAAKQSNRSYYFVPIFMTLVILYCITWILSAKKIIRNQLHRKIWNMILLVSALVSALLGVFLTINIDFGTNITLPFNMLFWHVEAGIALGIVAVFHICWHWRYFAKVLRIANQARE